ncbi:MAG: hypothetical protein WEB58_05725 [Planctomycetaceae bacterium]
MSRRKQRGELDIGSDSFLDIIANMVGILIILIVLAGLQVKDLPLAKLMSASSPDPHKKPAAASPVAPDEPADAPEETVVETPTLIEEPADDVAVAAVPRLTMENEESRPAATSPPPEEMTTELNEQLAGIRSELEQSDETIARLQNEFLNSRHRTLGLQERKQQLQTALEDAEKVIEQRREDYERARFKLDGVKGDYLNLQAEVDKALREKPPAKKVEHSLTAVSQEVLGEEWHFRVQGNQIAYVPVKELIERVQEEMKARRELLIKHSRYQGEIGPIEGFTLQYTIEKQSLSIVDELRYGQGIMRIGLTEWRIDPEPGFKGETLEQALKSRSRFGRQLQLIDPGTTLTFWVYPDGFETFRTVQAFAREKGYIVAGRPLPQGVPISGSPQGTRSAGQ